MGLLIEASLLVISCVISVAMLSVARERTRPDTQEEIEIAAFWEEIKNDSE
jgi:hypothetical protein